MLAGWLVSAWQVSLGFTLGLQYCYLLLVLALLVLFYWWRGRLTPGDAWRDGHEAREGREEGADEYAGSAAAAARPGSSAARGPLIPRRLLAVTCIGIAVLGAVAVYQARPYLKVASDYPTAKRTIKEVKTYSSGPAALAVGLLGEPRVGRRSPRERARKCTPRTRTCSSPAG